MFRILSIIPLAGMMIATSTVALARDITDFAKTCAEVINEPQRLHVRLAAVSRFDEAVVAHARQEVETIWKPYQIEIVWSDDTTEATATNADLVVEFVPTLPTHRAEAVAWVLFNAGHPLPVARVSIPAAYRLLAAAKSWFDGRPLTQSANVTRNMALGRIVGRALAHEIGHFLLASPHHTREGLMRAVIDADQFVRPGLGLFRLEDQDVRGLRTARLADCESARTMSSTAP
jgi:hypothetical protein